MIARPSRFMMLAAPCLVVVVMCLALGVKYSHDLSTQRAQMAAKATLPPHPPAPTGGGFTLADGRYLDPKDEVETPTGYYHPLVGCYDTRFGTRFVVGEWRVPAEDVRKILRTPGGGTIANFGGGTIATI